MLVIDSVLETEKHLDGIDAVIFDLDDTLYSEKDYVRSGYRKIAELFPCIPDMEECLWQVFERGGRAVDETLEAKGLTHRREEALRAYRYQQPDIRPYDGVLEMLERMGSTHKTGIITDGRPEGQRAKLKALGLRVDEIIITDELGGAQFRKPDEKAFLLMQQRMCVPFEKMAYVGDNPKKDFIAPEKLGMRCIFFKNPDGLYK